jgi:predicted XRE-type DNA-binding protein
MLVQIIEELVASGLSEGKIAGIVGASQPTINRIRNGKIKDAKHRLGSALVQLHAARVKQRPSSSPSEEQKAA